jgi:phage shock protein A
VVAVIGSLVVAVIRGVRLWRSFDSFNATLATELARVTDAATVTEAHVVALDERSERLEEATAQLQQSLARLRVLTDAAKSLGGQAAAVGRAVPKK